MNHIRIDHDWKIDRIHLVGHHHIGTLHILARDTFPYVDYNKDIRHSVDTFDLHSTGFASR